MPAFSTHYIFAKELIPFIENMADFDINKDAILIGTQGPDIFFSHRIFPWMIGKSLRKFGSQIHRAKPELLLENMREYCKISKNSHIAKSYVYGFILHYALDRKCHPYVYALQNEITQKHPLTNPHTAHNNIEFAIDSYLINKRLNISNPQTFDTAKVLHFDDLITNEIGKLWSYIALKIFNYNERPEYFSLAIKDMIQVQKVTKDTYGIKKAIVTPIEIILSPVSKNFKFTAFIRPKDLEKAKKYANIINKEWISPFTNEAHKESFEQLFDEAKDEAMQMLISYQARVSCKEITKNLSFLTGVEVK